MACFYCVNVVNTTWISCNI